VTSSNTKERKKKGAKTAKRAPTSNQKTAKHKHSKREGSKVSSKQQSNKWLVRRKKLRLIKPFLTGMLLGSFCNFHFLKCLLIMFSLIHRLQTFPAGSGCKSMDELFDGVIVAHILHEM
jgi:hypothetical protein